MMTKTKKAAPKAKAGKASPRRRRKSKITLVIDVGESMVGIFWVEDGTYLPYRGAKITSAIRRIEAADEVVTYSGIDFNDLAELARFAGRKLSRRGVHTDMRIICWSDEILGSSLKGAYFREFSDLPRFPATYEGINEEDYVYTRDNHEDVHMTFKLWDLWMQGKLRWAAIAPPQPTGDVHRGAKGSEAPAKRPPRRPTPSR
jgi:hypothetical protein